MLLHLPICFTDEVNPNRACYHSIQEVSMTQFAKVQATRGAFFRADIIVVLVVIVLGMGFANSLSPDRQMTARRARDEYEPNRPPPLRCSTAAAKRCRADGCCCARC